MTGSAAEGPVDVAQTSTAEESARARSIRAGPARRWALFAARGPVAEVEAALAVIYVVLRAVQTVQLVLIWVAGDPVAAGCPASLAAAVLAVGVLEGVVVMWSMAQTGSYGGRRVALAEEVTVVLLFLAVAVSTPASQDRGGAVLWLFSPAIVMTCGLTLHFRASTATVLATVPAGVVLWATSAGAAVRMGAGGALGFVTAFPVLALGCSGVVRFMRSLGTRLEGTQALLHAAGREEERLRQGAYLHDRVVGELEQTRQVLRRAPGDPASAQQALRVLCAVLEDARQVLGGRDPLGEDSLAAFRDDLRRHADGLGVDLRLHTDDLRDRDGADADPPPGTVLRLGSVAREALRNAAKHAECRSAVVLLALRRDGCTMTVTTRQARFDPAQLGPGGSGNTAYRLVHAAGGDLRVETGDGVVRIVVTMPYGDVPG